MKTADVGKATRYSGFKSFQYLEPGTDYREFKLAKELDRVPSRKVDVSSTQEDRVQRLLTENLAVSLHDHCFVVPADFGDLAEYRRHKPAELRPWRRATGLAVADRMRARGLPFEWNERPALGTAPRSAASGPEHDRT